MASVTSPTTLISSSTRAFPAKSYSPTSPSVSFLRTLSSPSSSASLRSAFAQRSSLSSSSRRSFAVKAQTVSLSQCRHFLVPLCLKIRVHYIGSVESLETVFSDRSHFKSGTLLTFCSKIASFVDWK